MLAIVKSRSFILGFLIGAILFLAINVYTYDDGSGGGVGDSQVTECFDCLAQLGWPFRLHRSGTIMHIDEILWGGLCGDGFVAIAASALVGGLTHLLFNTRDWRRSFESSGHV